MAQKKKLQVFISSTYTDLTSERQAAVEAVLTAGHIPAGMELFAAGDESQMSVIKRWIDESDVYLLILGGRYGSIEPASQKSYIHLEYEYAVEKGKPLFAVVIDEGHIEERVKQFGTKVIETEHSQKLKDFRALVLSRMSKFWRDPRDIKLAILETMSEFSRRDDLTGWIPGNEAVNGGALAEEIARLTKENAELRERAAKSSVPSTYSGLTFEDMYALLLKSKLDVSNNSAEMVERLEAIAKAFGHDEPKVLHVFWMLSGIMGGTRGIGTSSELLPLVQKLEAFGLVEFDSVGGEGERGYFYFYKLTGGGRHFLVRLRLEYDTEAAEQYILIQF